MTVSYSHKEIESLRAGGRALDLLMQNVGDYVAPGRTVHELEMKVRELIQDCGGKSATIGYEIADAPHPFTSAACISVNEGVVHGIAYQNYRVLEEGDIVSIDVVMEYQGVYVDICRSYGVGEISDEDQRLLEVAQSATNKAIEQAQVGNTVDDIGRAAQEVAHDAGMSTARELGGHGVGRAIHMPPFIPNFADSGFSDPIREGMVLAIEPIVMAGDWRVDMAPDGWLFVASDGKKSAQFEETVLITKQGPEILTQS